MQTITGVPQVSIPLLLSFNIFLNGLLLTNLCLLTCNFVDKNPLDYCVETTEDVTENLQSDLKVVLEQDSTITIISLYVITIMCQNFGMRDICGQVPKSMNQMSYLLPSDFPNNFS